MVGHDLILHSVPISVCRVHLGDVSPQQVRVRNGDHVRGDRKHWVVHISQDIDGQIGRISNSRVGRVIHL